MTKTHVPYLHRWRNRHGKWENFARFPGRKQVRLRGDLFSEQFWVDYQAAQADAPRPEIGASRTKPGTVAAAIVAYYGSVPFLNLAGSTQNVRRNIVERFRADHGDKRIVSLQRRHIAEMVAERAATTPAAAQVFLKVLRALMQFCVSVGLCNDDPTIGVKNVKLRSEGIYTWSEADIAKFEANHSIGSRPRLALALLLHSGQRRSDVIRMGRQHIRDGAVHLTQQKTGVTLAIPIHPELAAVIDATPSEHLTFLVTRDGSPFSPAGFGNHFRQWCNEAGLPKECSAHGLRKAACRRLAESGCSALEIMAISGHASLREVQRYCAAVNQVQMARSAMASVTSAFSSKPGT